MSGSGQESAHRTIERVARESYGRLVAYLSSHTRDVASAEASSRGRAGRFQLEDAIQSVHAERARGSRTEWGAIMLFYEQLIRISPTLGTRTGYAATVGEVNGPEAGLAALDAIDLEAVSGYQPYWAVRARLLQRLGKTCDAADAFDRAIGLAEDQAVKQFLLRRRGQFFPLFSVEIDSLPPSPL